MASCEMRLSQDPGDRGGPISGVGCRGQIRPARPNKTHGGSPSSFSTESKRTAESAQERHRPGSRLGARIRDCAPPPAPRGHFLSVGPWQLGLELPVSWAPVTHCGTATRCDPSSAPGQSPAPSPNAHTCAHTHLQPSVQSARPHALPLTHPASRPSMETQRAPLPCQGTDAQKGPPSYRGKQPPSYSATAMLFPAPLDGTGQGSVQVLRPQHRPPRGDSAMLGLVAPHC